MAVLSLNSKIFILQNRIDLFPYHYELAALASCRLTMIYPGERAFISFCQHDIFSLLLSLGLMLFASQKDTSSHFFNPNNLQTADYFLYGISYNT